MTPPEANMRYEAILDWIVTENQAKAYKLALTWECQAKKMFPEDRFAKLPNKGDPRKSQLFKYCWKLLRETRGLLEDSEYKLYIIANLTAMKKYDGRIEPNILCGDRAWWRWRVYKWIWDNKLAELNSLPPPPDVSSTNPKVVKELDLTKKFLFEKCDGYPTFDKIKGFIDSGKFKIWIGMGKVSLFYVVQSPFVLKACELQTLESACGFDKKLIQEKIRPEVAAYFEREFLHEYERGS